MRIRVFRSSFGLACAAALAGLGVGCGANGSDGSGGGGLSADAGDATTSSGSMQFGGGGDEGGSAGDDSGGSGGSNPCVPPKSLVVSPGSEADTVSTGTPFSRAFTATATYANNATADVTAQTFFSLGSAGVGSLTGSTFTWGGVTGGAVTVNAKTCGVTASATLTLKLAATFSGGGASSDGGAAGDGGGTTSGSFGGEFADAGATANASCNPTLVYPPDGVLLPPNTNVIEVHFMPGTASAPNTQFELSFENAVTDVRIYTTCAGTTPDQGMPINGGCAFELSQAEWDYVAQTNAGGDPVTVKVRGIGCDNANVGSSNTRQISFAQEPLDGTLYYWASMRIGTNTFSGGVFRYDFGVRGQSADPVLTPTNGGGGLCIGCHDISRDGRKMLFDLDDNDSDDEYSDVNTDVFDVPSRTFATGGTLSKGRAFPPGFHTWNRAHSRFLLSDGSHQTAAGEPNGSFAVRGQDAGLVGYTPAPPATIRGTTPDLAPDDSSLVFAAAPNQGGGVLTDGGLEAGYWPTGNPPQVPQQDEWFSGASLYTAPWNQTPDQIGTETLLVPSNGTSNYYYPSYSPEGSLIVFNYAPDGPNFHNPKARVQLVKTGVANPTPDDLANLNNDPTNNGLVTNSWARWAPFVQAYKQGKILWLTMSSTRTYGLRVENDGTANCYPKESPIGAPYSTRTFTNTSLSPACSRAQLWMAAVKLDADGVAAGQDVSFPAFWLPFQDITTNNHLGQWAQRSYTGTCNPAADAGAAPDAGGCAPGLCCDNGACAPCLAPPAAPPPAPPPANACAISANCAPGTCCQNGTCGSCSSSGGSGGDAGGPGGMTCNTCLDCNGQACNGGACGGCTSSDQCCAPYVCSGGQCIEAVIPR